MLLKVYLVPVAIVLPHHNLVQNVRQSFLKNISHSRPITKTIILIGPDHFSPFQTSFSYSNLDWNLSNGIVSFDKNLFSKISFPISLRNGVIRNDHAIYNVLPDIKTYWPNTKIIPILIGQKVPLSNLDSLITQLSFVCGFDCLLVTSVDFSHYLPATMAETHDAFTIRTLNNLDISNIKNVEVDSPQSLYILEKFSVLKNAKNFSLFARTNSGFITSNPDIETTTHVFASYTRGFSSKIILKTSISTSQKIDRSKNQDTLGDRFFYGVDEFIIDPSQDFVVSTISTPYKVIKSFFPIRNNLFLRGNEKQLLIKQYFDSLPNEQNLTKDYFWSKLIYDRK